MKFRILVLAAFVVMLGMLRFETASVNAQQKKGANNNDAQLKQHINQLEQKVKQLQAQLNNAKKDDKTDDNKIKDLQNKLNAAKKDDKTDDNKILDLTTKLKDKDVKIAQLQAELKNKSVIHSMTLRVKGGVDSKAAQKSIEEASKKFGKIDGVRTVYYGKPKGSSEEFGLVVVLDSAAALQAFLRDGGHKTLEKNFKAPTVFELQK